MYSGILPGYKDGKIQDICRKINTTGKYTVESNKSDTQVETPYEMPCSLE